MRRAAAVGLIGLSVVLLTGCGGGSGSEGTTVRGRLRWTAEASFPSDAALRVRVNDISLADGPSETVGERLIEGVATDAGKGEGLPFAVTLAEPLEAGRSYTVSVAMDVNGDGRVGEGDYISEAITPVLDDGGRLRSSVEVQLTPLEPCGSPGGGGYCADGSGKPL